MSDQPFDPAVNEAAMREDGARRCCVCRCRYPFFGFGPPLARGKTLWACAAHVVEVDALIQRGQV
jgi:hypothetical protein